MSEVQRGAASRDGVIDADIDTLWAVLVDWGNLDWYGSDDVERDGMKLGSISLEGGETAVPRTRVLTRSNAVDAGLPLVNRERLLLEDPVSHRLYYDADDGFILGTRNYIATWYVDPLPDGRCRMTIQSRFDVVAPGSAEVTRDTVEEVYDAILLGLNRYVKRQGGSAGRVRPRQDAARAWR